MKNSFRQASSNPELPTKRQHPTGPKWLRTSKAVVQGKGTEMVTLSRDSPLSNIPAEIQLDIVFFLSYDDVVSLKKTSRYFLYFLSPGILHECKQTQIDRWAEIEKQGGWPDHFPCYDCLQLKPKAEFYINGTYAYSRATRGNADTTRHCILCSFKNNEYDPGTCLAANGQSWVLCACCGELKNDLPQYTSSKVCKLCKTSFDIQQEHGYLLRFSQLFFAIVVWALACSGKLPPRTSVANKHSLRFIFQSLISIITISCTLNSLIIRGEVKKWHGYRTTRQQNGKFVFRVELLALLCWIAILGAVINEGITLHFSGRFDKIAKAMLSMLVFLCMCFAASAWWAYKVSLLRRRVVSKFGVLPEINA